MHQPSTTPTHIGIIMDGNGRWAKSQGKSRSSGHQAGVKKAIEIVKHASNKNISYLTLYAFSNENWSRPNAEVSTLMQLLRSFLFSELPTFIEHKVKLTTIGDTSKLPFLARQALARAIDKTKDHDGLTLVLALSYSGRNEIMRALQQICKQKPDISKIDENMIAAHLDTQNMPDPDLIIRTSGELRTSNFLLWQSAYSEYYVTQTFWPDFTPQEFDKAIADFVKRDRRFGGIA